MTEEERKEMQSVGFNDVRLEDLTDIRNLRIDNELPVTERRRQYLRRVGNPYMVRVGDTMVKISFSDNGTSFEEAFEDLLAT